MEDERRFTALFDRHRRELHVHCHRVLGSFDEAEDAVQDAFLRAWRSRATARGEFRAWLYRIATNASLDAPARRLAATRWAAPAGGAPIAEVGRLQPYPDALLDELVDRVPDPAAGPDAVVVARETIELAFLAAGEGADLDAFAGLLAEHARHTMPPLPVQVHGRAAILDSWRPVLAGPQARGQWRGVLTAVNRRPVVTQYLHPTREIAFPDGTRGARAVVRARSPRRPAHRARPGRRGHDVRRPRPRRPGPARAPGVSGRQRADRQPQRTARTQRSGGQR